MRRSPELPAVESPERLSGLMSSGRAAALA